MSRAWTRLTSAEEENDVRHAAGALFAAAIAVKAAYADAPGKDWISSGQVSHALEKTGYRVIKVETDDRHWAGEPMRGRTRFEFPVDPHSGRITKLERDDD